MLIQFTIFELWQRKRFRFLSFPCSGHCCDDSCVQDLHVRLLIVGFRFGAKEPSWQPVDKNYNILTGMLRSNFILSFRAHLSVQCESPPAKFKATIAQNICTYFRYHCPVRGNTHIRTSVRVIARLVLIPMAQPSPPPHPHPLAP